jgi:NAD(P)-dependent dehydrogenase (short-subunit alcohol dehydrogenase family)
MDFGIGGKTAYVTGGAMGIGAAIADALAAEGVRLAVSDLARDELEAHHDAWTVNGRPPLLIPVDLGTREGAVAAAERVLAELGPPDILVNNVGVGVVRSFEQIADEEWLRTLELNLMSYVRTSRRSGRTSGRAPAASPTRLEISTACRPSRRSTSSSANGTCRSLASASPPTSLPSPSSSRHRFRST